MKGASATGAPMPAPAPLRDNGAICCQPMRHLLAAAAVVLMAGPAMAVDYLQCEAMQNAKERIIKSSTAIQVEIAKAELEAIRSTAGGPLDQRDMAQLVARQDTYSNLRNGIGSELAVADMKKIQKVEADQKKAGCP